MRKHHPHYEIIPSASAFYVVRVIDGRGQIIDRFATRTAAEDFMAFLTHANAVSRFLAVH